MVVDAGLSGRIRDLRIILGRFPVRIRSDEELVLAVGITVVVVELVVELELDVAVDPPVQAERIGFGSTSVDGATIKVDGLVTGAELDVTPLPAPLDTGVFTAVGVVALLAAEEKVTGLDVPAAEVLGGRVGRICLEMDIVADIGSLIAETKIHWVKIHYIGLLLRC